MNFLTKLENLMAQRNLNKRTLARLCDVPYTTVASFWDKGYQNVKLSTIERICAGLGVSLDYLARDDITDPAFDPSNVAAATGPLPAGLTWEEWILVQSYRGALPEYQAVVMDILAAHQKQEEKQA